MSRAITDQFIKHFIDGDAHGMLALCRPDALVDTNVPQWRFQTNPEALLGGLRENTELPDREISVGYHEATADGAVIEVETRGSQNGEAVMVRELWALRSDGERITEWVVFCTGPWDAATIERQRAEAPMVRR